MLRYLMWTLWATASVSAQEKWVKLLEIPATPSAIDFSGNTGYVVCKASAGDTNPVSEIFRTADGGANWASVKLPGIFFAVQAVGESVAYLSGDRGAIYRSINGGSTWTPISNPLSGLRDVGILSLDFRDADHGFLSGFATILKTTDGGDSWTRLTAGTHPALAPQLMESIQFPEAGIGFAAGSGPVLKSTDSGATWRQPAPLPGNPLYVVSMHFLDARQGFATGHLFREDPNRLVAGRVYGTKDSGETWSILREFSALGDFPEKVRFISPQTGYGVSFQSFFKTTDGGMTWQVMDSDLSAPLPTTSVRPLDVIALTFSENGTGYALRGSLPAGAAAPTYHVWKLAAPLGIRKPPSRPSKAPGRPLFPIFHRRGADFDASGRWIFSAPLTKRP